MVDAEDGPAGFVTWSRAQIGKWAFCWSVGIILRAPARGRGAGARAQRPLAEYLFTHTLVNRIEADTDHDNVAEQRALEKAGFVSEGVLHGYDFRAGLARPDGSGG